MFGFVKKASAFVHRTFDKCMTIPDYNSRLVFLGTAVFTQILMVWHTFNYLRAVPTERDPAYPEIIAILLAGHGVSAFGRFMTKRVGEKQDADKDASAPVGADGDKG